MLVQLDHHNPPKGGPESIVGNLGLIGCGIGGVLSG